MFVVFILVVCLIISLVLVTLLFNCVNKFVYLVSGYGLSEFFVVRCVLVGVLLTVLCVLEYDLVSGCVALLF